MNRKLIGSTVGVIVLGALGSGLWELVKPLLGWGWEALIGLSTLGLSSLRDGLYLQAALTTGRPIGIGTAVQSLSAMVLLTASITLRGIAAAAPADSKRFLRQISLILLFGATTMLVASARTAYVVRLAVLYERLEVVAAPLLSDLELKQYRAQFVGITNRAEYLAVIGALSRRIEQAGQKPAILSSRSLPNPKLSERVCPPRLWRLCRVRPCGVCRRHAQLKFGRRSARRFKRGGYSPRLRV